MTSRRAQLRAAASLVEVLVAAAVIGLLLGILIPTLSAGRRGGLRLKCISQLKVLGQHAAGYAATDPRGILHPQSPSGELAWLGLGAWDYGGADGACGENSSRSPIPMHLGAARRPFNLAQSGPAMSDAARFAEYRCPADTGAQPNPNYTPSYVDPAPCDADAAAEVIGRSMTDAKGTSYQGDFLWFADRSGDALVARRFGSFMRPASTMLAASELTLFYETRFAQAYLSTREAQDASGGALAPTPLDVPGWHGPGSQFNLLLCDGNVRTVTLRHANDALDAVLAFPPGLADVRSVMIRGAGWRIDNLPLTEQGWVIER
ncbi:MAG: hypothetical protein U1A27_07255 [Phycisphaerae bacterium]